MRAIYYFQVRVFGILKDNYGGFIGLVGLMEEPNKETWIYFETFASWNLG